VAIDEATASVVAGRRRSKMTTSQKVGLAIVFGAVVFLLMAAYGVLPGLIAVCVIALRLVWGIGVLYVIAYIKNAGKPKEKGQ
jgi:putative Mn2+ efflux pump MntP